MGNTSKNCAIIDMGTNTFHLLIARRGAEGQIEPVYRERRFVKLAEEGIETIGAVPFQRAVDTMEAFRGLLREHGVEQVRALGTAALRTASNGPALMALIAQRFGIETELISGDEEARLIYQGVAMVVPLGAAPSLIMDIGGGSVEFILANAEGMLWRQSFPTGLAVMLQAFPHSEPITAAEVADIRAALSEAWQPLYVALARHPTQRLVGAAGTFDLMITLLPPANGAQSSAALVPLERFGPLYERMLRSDNAARMADPNIPPERVDMIVVAFIMLAHVLDTVQVTELTASAYALKEGAFGELFERA